jgi:hypothetical protein
MAPTPLEQQLFESRPEPSTADAGYAKAKEQVPSPHAYENQPGPQIADVRYGGPRPPLGQSLKANQHVVVHEKFSTLKAEQGQRCMHN